jgi:hypothetical protein
MGVDPDEMIEKTEQKERALWDYTSKYLAFKGELLFDLTITLRGKSVTTICESRPISRARTALSTTSNLQLFQKYESDGWREAAPEWFKAEDMVHNGVLTEEIWEAVLDAIDEECKAEDAERRGATGR